MSAPKNEVPGTVAYYRAALEKIAKREGPYSRDHLTHASNVIDAMADVATDALAHRWTPEGDAP